MPTWYRILIPAKPARNGHVTTENQTKNHSGMHIGRLWGTGIPLNDPNCLDSSKWINQGIMGQILEGIHNNVLQSQPHLYSWSVNSNPPEIAVNTYQYPTAQNTGHANANVVANNIPPSASDPAPDNSQHPLPRQSIEHLTTTTDSESASTTPVSNTTASDAEISELNTKHPETKVSLMEDSTPAQEGL